MLPPTPGADKRASSRPSTASRPAARTNGGAGIELAYEVAAENFIKGGINRVILGTDGDFNVGVTSQGELVRLIEESEDRRLPHRARLRHGQPQGRTLERLADKGNGNYAYIDTLDEARKVLVEQVSGTLVTVAKDVKIQVEFNPRAGRRATA